MIRLLVMLSLLSGCASNPEAHVRVTSEPPASTLTIAYPDGRILVSEPTPFVTTMDFTGDIVFNVTGVPPEGNTNYVRTRTTIDESQLTPSERKREFDLKVTLARHDFELMTVLDIALHAQRGLVGVLGLRRSFDSEDVVGGPREVIALDDHLGMHGLELSRSGARAVFSSVDIDEAALLTEDRVIQIEDADLSIIDLLGPGISRESDDMFINIDPSFSADGESLIFSTNRLDDDGYDLARQPASSFSAGATFLRTDENDTWRFVSPTQGVSGIIVHDAVPFDWTGPADPSPPQIQSIGGRAGAFPVEHTTGQMPAVSPDGRRIAFIREGDLYVYDTQREWTTQLTFDAAQIVEEYRLGLTEEDRVFFDETELNWTFFANAHPTWSADGVYILYSSWRAKDTSGTPNEDVWVVHADGVGAPQQLTTNYSADRFPVVTPDRNWVYFVSNRDQQWALWRMPTQGTLLDPAR